MREVQGTPMGLVNKLVILQPRSSQSLEEVLLDKLAVAAAISSTRPNMVSVQTSSLTSFQSLVRRQGGQQPSGGDGSGRGSQDRSSYVNASTNNY